jgi:biopolymer transport protein TolR
MRRSRRIRMDEHQIRAEVNVTSLVDIAFVLLVIFVMTAPMMIGGVEVNLPQGDVKPLSSESKPFYVTIRKDGRIFVEQTPMTLRDYEQSFGQLMRASPVEAVYIRGDSAVSYGLLVRVMGTVVKTGKPFKLLAEPLEAGQ